MKRLILTDVEMQDNKRFNFKPKPNDYYESEIEANKLSTRSKGLTWKQEYERDLKRWNDIQQKAPIKPKTDLFVLSVYKQIGVKFDKEVRFHPTRLWRFDYANEHYKIAIEVEGGVWTEGRHTRGKGFLGDMEKYNTATALGWRLLRVTPDTLLTTNTINLIKQVLKCKEAIQIE